jgi:type I restriction enzyme S subunit
VFRYLGMEHVAPGQWDEPTPVELPGAEIKSQVIMYRPGVVLYGKLRPYLNKVVVPSAEGVASTEFVPLAVKEDMLEPRYLGAYLRAPSFVAYATQNTTGSRQPRVRLDALWRTPVPLPPLAEQRRIVARIEELMGRVREARRLRQEAQKDAERLWQSVLAQTFPRAGSQLPEGWRWVRLGQVSRIYAGSPAPQGEHCFADGKWPFVRVQDLGRYGQTTRLDKTADYVNEYAVQKYPLRLAKAGTILFPKSGAAILTNSRAVLGVDAYVVSHLAAVEPLPDRLDNYWTYFWLCTVDMKELIDNPSYPSLRLSEIAKLPIPLPPLADQRRIVANLEALHHRIKALKEAQSETETELRRLEQAILDKAFRGEL